MNIVHVTWSLCTGGVETMLVDILNEQAKSENVHLVVLNNVHETELLESISSRVKCHYVGRDPGSRSLSVIIKYNYLIYKLKPDILHCHNHTIRDITFLGSSKYKSVLTVHNTKATKINSKKFDKIFAISSAVQSDLKKKFGFNSIVVPNGIKTDVIQKRDGYAFDTFKIVQVGRLFVRDKGQDILLRAISHLRKEDQQVNLSLDFIGDGESKDNLVKLAQELGVDDICNFLLNKTRSYIYDNLKNYNLLVQPSRSEGFGLTIVEAQAACVPVLVSDLDSMMDIISNGEHGYYFRRNDSEMCANKISEIIDGYGSDDLMLKVHSGCANTELNYSIQNTSQKYLDNYK